MRYQIIISQGFLSLEKTIKYKFLQESAKNKNKTFWLVWR